MNRPLSTAGVLEKLRQAVLAYGNQKAAAKAWHLSAPYLSDVLSGKRAPGPKILKVLHLKRVETYVKAAASSER